MSSNSHESLSIALVALDAHARLFPQLGVLQNNPAPMIIGDSPLLDLLQRSKATEADEVIVQAAISYARGLSGAVEVIHLR
jgi:hypothetical protein